MAYPKQPKQENTNAENMVRAPLPQALPSAKLKPVGSPSGGAPPVKPSAAINVQAPPKPTVRRLFERKLPTPPVMTLQQAQERLKDLTAQVKTRLDQTSQNPAVVARNPAFWRAYSEFPEGVAAMTARRMYTDQIVGRGAVADWLTYIEGMNK